MKRKKMDCIILVCSSCGTIFGRTNVLVDTEMICLFCSKKHFINYYNKKLTLEIPDEKVEESETELV